MPETKPPTQSDPNALSKQVGIRPNPTPEWSRCARTRASAERGRYRGRQHKTGAVLGSTPHIQQNIAKQNQPSDPGEYLCGEGGGARPTCELSFPVFLLVRYLQPVPSSEPACSCKPSSRPSIYLFTPSQLTWNCMFGVYLVSLLF